MAVSLADRASDPTLSHRRSSCKPAAVASNPGRSSLKVMNRQFVIGELAADPKLESLTEGCLVDAGAAIHGLTDARPFDREAFDMATARAAWLAHRGRARGGGGLMAAIA